MSETLLFLYLLQLALERPVTSPLLYWAHGVGRAPACKDADGSRAAGLGARELL